MQRCIGTTSKSCWYRCCGDGSLGKGACGFPSFILNLIYLTLRCSFVIYSVSCFVFYVSKFSINIVCILISFFFFKKQNHCLWLDHPFLLLLDEYVLLLLLFCLCLCFFWHFGSILAWRCLLLVSCSEIYMNMLEETCLPCSYNLFILIYFWIFRGKSYLYT